MGAGLGAQNFGGLNPERELGHSKRRRSGLLRIQGELDDLKARHVKDEIERMKKSGIRKITIDMGEVTSFTLLGIGTLGDFLSELGGDGDEIGISGLKESLKRLFKRFGYPGIVLQDTWSKKMDS